MTTTQNTHTIQLDFAYDDDFTGPLEQAIASAVAHYFPSAPSLTAALVTADGPSGWPLVAFSADTADELNAYIDAYDAGL